MAQVPAAGSAVQGAHGQRLPHPWVWVAGRARSGPYSETWDSQNVQDASSHPSLSPSLQSDFLPAPSLHYPLNCFSLTKPSSGSCHSCSSQRAKLTHCPWPVSFWSLMLFTEGRKNMPTKPWSYLPQTFSLVCYLLLFLLLAHFLFLFFYSEIFNFYKIKTNLLRISPLNSSPPKKT